MSNNTIVFIFGIVTGSGFMLVIMLVVMLGVAFRMGLINMQTDLNTIATLLAVIVVVVLGLVISQTEFDVFCMYKAGGKRICY